MPRKLPRPDEQVAQLADELRGRWVAADGIEPWLRRNSKRLSKLVREGGWSWADVGRALTTAGVLYGTGRPWTGPLLAAKMSQVRTEARERADKQAAVANAKPPPRQPALPLPPPGVVPLGPLFGGADATSEFFAPARLKPGGAMPEGAASPAPAPAPLAKSPAHDPDEVLGRFLGQPQSDKEQ